MLNQCLVKLINTKPATISEDYEKAIIANMFALLEWCMSMPLDKLKENDRGTLLRNNFKLIIHICSTFKPTESPEAEHVHLAARFIIQHLLTQLNHFPYASTGPSKIVSSVNETSDLLLNSLDELTPTLFEQPNIQFFTVNNQFLISFVELPMKGNEAFFNINPKLRTSPTICRFIVRDFCGKNCWDCCILQSPSQSLPDSYMLDVPSGLVESGGDSGEELAQADDSGEAEGDLNDKFDFTRLPFLGFEEIPKNIDILDNVSGRFLIGIFCTNQAIKNLVKIYKIFHGLTTNRVFFISLKGISFLTKEQSWPYFLFKLSFNLIEKLLENLK